GTAWILSAGGEAPEGEYGVISDFAQSAGGTFTIPTVTATVASTDRYAVTSRMFPLDILVQSVNRALFDMGKVPTTDITTMDSANSQTEYDLPIAANLDLREVWLEMNIDDADDFRWKKQHSWYVQRTATGSADLLVLPYQWPADREIKLVYVAPHPEMYTASTQLSESIPPERVMYKAAYHALKWYSKRHPREVAAVDDMQRYENISIKYEIDLPIYIPPRTGKVVLRGGDEGYDFEAGKVRL
ncbi:unnamed protein product, partial [marine sediment metagenome]